MSLDTPDGGTGPLETPTLVLSSDDEETTKAENKDLALRVYKQVWDEFNKWKTEDSQHGLLLLQKPTPSPEAAEATTAMASALHAGTGRPGDVEIIYLCDDTEDDVPLDARGATVLTCDEVLLAFPPHFSPHPRYEACTPSVQTIASCIEKTVESAGDIGFETAPFVPYADDPSFDVRGYLEQFKYFAWERLGNPDVEVIQFEVLHRLRNKHGLSLDDIDATGVLPKLRESNQFGLIYKMTQRDELFWTGRTADIPTTADGPQRRGIDPREHEPDINDLRRRIDSVVPYFCAYPGCIQFMCPLHGGVGFPPVPPAVPRVASDDYPEGSSCENMCFREIDATFQEDSVEWRDSELDELRCILEIIPDTVPCGLAKLVRRPCREVFVQRRRLIPDARVYPVSSQTVTAVEKVGYRDDYSLNEYYSPPHPCSHIGPCDINNPDCTCVKGFVHCVRSCHCSTNCKHRWKGCRCRLKKVNVTKKQTCIENHCPCRKRGWECDPMVCECDNELLGVIPRWKPPGKRAAQQPRVILLDGEHFCQNSDMQRGLIAELEIKRGVFGLGAFAVNRIRDGQYIGEYVGELMERNGESGNRQPLREHVDLNYNFGLTKKEDVDSARVGNETRYLNHGKDKANAKAQKKLVFGVPRIGFWAERNIKAGDEILFDYGEEYWKKYTKSKSSVAVALVAGREIRDPGVSHGHN
ncbi:hypothetical protein BC827DRAFT_1241027 [Russula dissimulans]|nr:hypothetical protein BC827DRAFT_1241027 [Russula dissimulans]